MRDQPADQYSRTSPETAEKGNETPVHCFLPSPIGSLARAPPWSERLCLTDTLDGTDVAPPMNRYYRSVVHPKCESFSKSHLLALLVAFPARETPDWDVNTPACAHAPRRGEPGSPVPHHCPL